MFENYWRVMRTARRPSMGEFKRSAWLVGLGMLLIGGMGLLINLAFQVIGI